MPILCNIEIAQTEFVVTHRVTIHKSHFEVIGLRVKGEGFVERDVLPPILNNSGLLGLTSQLEDDVWVLQLSASYVLGAKVIGYLG